MQENEFEKKVQQRMDEFRLRPSEAVWGKVAGELKRKKKRRVVFFIFLMAAGLSLLGYTGYYLSNQSKQNIVEQISIPGQKESSSTDQAAQPSTNSSAGPISAPALNDQDKEQASDNREEKLVGPENKNSAESKKLIIPGNKNQELTKMDDAIAGRPAEKKVGRDNTDQSNKIKTPAEKKNRELAQQKRIAKTEKNRTEIPAITGNQEKEDDEVKPGEKKDPEEKKDIAQIEEVKESPEDTSVVVKDPGSIARADVTELKSLEEELTKADDPSKAKKQRKINWGLNFSAGAVDGRKSALPFGDGQKSMDSYSYSAPTQGFPGSIGYFPPRTPSPVNPGFGFKLGPVGEVELSKRSRLSLGIQYAYMSTKMKIGTYSVASIVINNSFSQSLRVNAAYQGTYQQDYTNRYHFIQIPVMYHLQLNKGKILPINWNVGASGGYLVATNGVLYDSAAGGIYYKDRNAYNKFQFNLHTGIDFRFGNNKRMQWSVGPELSMTMSKLVNDPYSRKQYLMYGGLTGRLILSKKK